MYKGILLNCKKEQNGVMWVDPERATQNAVSQRKPIYSHIYMWKLEKWYRRSYSQNRNQDRDIEKNI